MTFEKPKLPKVEQEKIIEKLDLRNLKTGDQVTIKTADSPDNISIYKINLIGKTKGKPRVKVENQYIPKGEPKEPEIFTARWTAGGFDLKSLGGRESLKDLSDEEKETTQNIVAIGGRLFFESLKNEQGEPESQGSVSMEIVKISDLIKKEDIE